MAPTPASLTRPTFSISLPVRGQAQFVGSALESIVAQQVDYELAVLDATPDDSVQEVLSRYRHAVTYRYHREDDGQAAAIQEGWDRTSGEILAWLNADDYYYPDALSRVARVFAAHPEVDVVYGHAAYVGTSGAFCMNFPAISADPTQLPAGCMICQPSCFVRRSAVEQVGGLNVRRHFTMDWDLWLRLYRAGCRFRFLDELLSVVRDYPETKTRGGGRRRMREIRQILREHNPSWLSRRASVLGNQYYRLMTARETLLDHLGYRLLYALNRGFPHRPTRPTGRERIRGIECWTNLVQDTCEVSLPRYGSRISRESLRLLVDRPVSLEATLGGSKLELHAGGTRDTVFLGRKLTGHQVSARLPRGVGPLLSFTLRCDEGPWRLLSLDVS